VDHPAYGRHIELGVKGDDAGTVAAAFQHLKEGLIAQGAGLGPELVHQAGKTDSQDGAV